MTESAAHPPPATRLERLTARQAAARLGVKLETLYAYVSRGMLESHRAKGERASRFDAIEVERFAARRRRGRPSGGLEVVLGTALTCIDEGTLLYRGLPATTLARTHSFEAVASWLWTGEHPGSATGAA